MRISDWSSDVCSSDLLFGGPVIEEEVEASAMLFGQTRPARSVVSEKIMRIEHVDTLVKKTAMARPVLAEAPLGSASPHREALQKIGRSHPISWDGGGCSFD